MKFWVRLVRSLPPLVAGLCLCGCLPSAQRMDEEKEPHYLTGKSRAEAMDYPGAVEEFEKALEVNPQSGSAHLELGVLLEQKENDPAAAIYHYNQYLKLHPGAGNTDIVKQRILSCKQELARTVSLGPVSEKQQRDLEKLAEESKRLTEENKRLNEEVTKWRAYYAERGQAEAAGTAAAPSRSGPAAMPPLSTNAGGGQVGPVRAVGLAGAGADPAARRTHTVKQGETVRTIARQYGVKVESLLAANPRLDPRRMRAGQMLVIPPP